MLQAQLSNLELRRSPLFYVGDKYKLINEIRWYFPNIIARFIEPFVGGGTVFLNVQANQYYMNDLSPHVCELHKYLQKQTENPDRLFKEIKKVILSYGLSRSYLEDIVPAKLKEKHHKTYYAKFNKSAFEKLRSDFNCACKKNPLILYLLVIYGFNRMLRFNAKGLFNVPVGNVDFNENVERALRDYLNFSKSKVLKFYCLDYKEFIKNMAPKENDFVYLDPPYLITLSEYNRLWDHDHEEELYGLLDSLDKKNIRFALSNLTDYRGRENVILKKWMVKYKVNPINSNYISYHNNKKKKINEVLVTNY